MSRPVTIYKGNKTNMEDKIYVVKQHVIKTHIIDKWKNSVRKIMAKVKASRLEDKPSLR